jgi:thioredoxin-dependent peroxiredoxin
MVAASPVAAVRIALTERGARENSLAMAIAEGKKAPAFTLSDQDGKTVSLSDFAGKDVVLYFYPKDDTPGCTKEACGFRDDWKKYTKRGAVVLGVSGDSGASHQKFRAKYKLPFTLLSDPDKKTMRAYGAYGEKMMYGKKVTGVIRSTVWIGPDGVVKKHWARVPKADEHPAKVLEALGIDS